MVWAAGVGKPPPPQLRATPANIRRLPRPALPTMEKGGYKVPTTQPNAACLLPRTAYLGGDEESARTTATHSPTYPSPGATFIRFLKQQGSAAANVPCLTMKQTQQAFAHHEEDEEGAANAADELEHLAQVGNHLRCVGVL